MCVVHYRGKILADLIVQTVFGNRMSRPKVHVPNSGAKNREWAAACGCLCRFSAVRVPGLFKAVQILRGGNKLDRRSVTNWKSKSQEEYHS